MRYLLTISISLVIIFCSCLVGKADGSSSPFVNPGIAADTNRRLILSKDVEKQMDSRLVCLYNNANFFQKANQRELFNNRESFELVRNLSISRVASFLPRLYSLLKAEEIDKHTIQDFEVAVCPGEGKIYFRGDNPEFYILGSVAIAEGFSIPNTPIVNREIDPAIGNKESGLLVAEAQEKNVAHTPVEVLMIPKNQESLSFVKAWRNQVQTNQSEMRKREIVDVLAKKIREILQLSMKANFGKIMTVEKQESNLHIYGQMENHVGLADGSPSFASIDLWLQPEIIYFKAQVPKDFEVTASIYPYTQVFLPKPLWPCEK